MFNPYYDKDKVDFHREQYSRLDFSRETTKTQTDKVVKMEELERYLAEGWTFVEKIDEEKAVIRES